MMRALLADRFKLRVHKEKKELEGFALVVAKGGAKLTPAERSADADGRYFSSRSRMSPGGNGTMEYNANTMEFLAKNLAMLIGRLVIDQTRLDRTYSLTLEYNRYDTASGSAIRTVGGRPPEREVEPGVSLFTSIQKYGLKLEARKIPGEMIVVDRIERTPTEN